MTPREFKAWFDGFTEAMTGTPTKAQWSRIKERVAEIDGNPISYPVFMDRYWSPYYPIWNNGIAGATTYTGWSSSSAMNAVGRNEAVLLAK